jgi:ribosomal protein L37AE/L43A
MSAPAPRWRCHDCDARFATPSFSEGPKTWDDDLKKVVRFRESLLLCPECLSTNLAGSANPAPFTPIQVVRP